LAADNVDAAEFGLHRDTAASATRLVGYIGDKARAVGLGGNGIRVHVANRHLRASIFKAPTKAPPSRVAQPSTKTAFANLARSLCHLRALFQTCTS